jgi:hypothetical protein
MRNFSTDSGGYLRGSSTTAVSTRYSNEARYCKPQFRILELPMIQPAINIQSYDAIGRPSQSVVPEATIRQLLTLMLCRPRGC